LKVNSTAPPTTRAPNNSGATESENVFSVSRYFSTGFKSAPNTPVVECTAYLSELANALPATNLKVTLLPSFERTPFLLVFPKKSSDFKLTPFCLKM